jgi:hypothetical protein
MTFVSMLSAEEVGEGQRRKGWERQDAMRVEAAWVRR